MVVKKTQEVMSKPGGIYGTIILAVAGVFADRYLGPDPAKVAAENAAAQQRALLKSQYDQVAKAFEALRLHVDAKHNDMVGQIHQLDKSLAVLAAGLGSGLVSEASRAARSIEADRPPPSPPVAPSAITMKPFEELLQQKAE